MLRTSRPFLLPAFALVLSLMVSGCDISNSNDKNDENAIEPPETYEFTRNGESTVAYPGQTDRLDMVEAMKAYIATAHDGETISEQALLDMFENTDGNGGGHFTFTSERQLKNKTFGPDLDENLFEDFFAKAAAASENGEADEGVPGLMRRGDGYILVDAKGREFTQLVEKGLMGAVFYNQIFNVYLTNDRIGPNVENEALREGTNYTDKEHHFDEAYGYFDAPVDFESDWPDSRTGELRFWSKYSNGSDPQLGFNDTIMEAFIQGRTAIINDNQGKLEQQVEVLYENLELLAAATAVHYINSTLSHWNEGNQGEAFHALSEAWAFVNALKYNPDKTITPGQIDQILNSDFGENGSFWNVTLDGLNNAKSTLVDTYPDLEPVQDQL
ncbi:protein of unknown function [Fodinibius roseus]|uniref:DUF4856 domain-containing protein n=1 Tax=Fodinibius roseus TaxID=1194090 RepID=A0A1M4UGN9_9BACT|nr:DUF4856 domain-containing protein [Fodinibius roseus]SHE55962.1 protein of unknown function [Fodinibius roseus]